jgi:hypothetical protein
MFRVVVLETCSYPIEDDPIGAVADAIEGNCTEEAVGEGVAPFGEI